jgi:3-deoxy-D-manno-octulosonic acid kinase
MDRMPGAGGKRESFRGPDGEVTIVFDPARVGQADPAWFDPASYGERARAVSGAGGRGAAWFVDGPFGAAVLRHYLRGGWMARLSRDGFLWRGASAGRGFHEFELLRRLGAMGLPVPAAFAAAQRRRGWRYRAAILVGRIPDVDSFAARVRRLGASAPWEAVGRAIAACHRKGARHADLNANNLLVDAAGEVHVIDWDKGRIEAAAGPWCERVLRRLERSLRKECGEVPAPLVEAGMLRLRAAHERVLHG